MSVSRYLGIAMCAPVSPPVVVVLLKSRFRWSCDTVTTMTLAIVMIVMAPGTHHQEARPEPARVRAGWGGVGAEAGADAVAGGASCMLTASMSCGSITVDRVPMGAA